MEDMGEFYYSNYTQTCGRLLGHKRYENLVTWATFPWPHSGKAIKYLIPYSWYHLKSGRGFFSHSLLKFGISESSRKNLYCHWMDVKKTFRLSALLVFLLQLCLSSGENLYFLFWAYLIHSQEFNCLFYCSSSHLCLFWFTSRKK